MIKLDLGEYRTGVIWLPKITELSSGLEPLVAKQKGIVLDGDRNSLRSSIVLEMSTYTGGMVRYGKIAVQLTDNTGVSTTDVEILKMNKNGNSEYRLLQKIEPWIDSDYYEGILKGATDAAKQYKNLPKKIQIYSGAQGEVGSSLRFFYLVSYTAVILLSAEESEFQRVVTDSFSSYNSLKINLSWLS